MCKVEPDTNPSKQHVVPYCSLQPEPPLLRVVFSIAPRTIWYWCMDSSPYRNNMGLHICAKHWCKHILTSTWISTKNVNIMDVAAVTSPIDSHTVLRPFISRYWQVHCLTIFATSTGKKSMFGPLRAGIGLPHPRSLAKTHQYSIHNTFFMTLNCRAGPLMNHDMEMNKPLRSLFICFI